MTTTDVQEQAIKILDGMAGIVQREMLKAGLYLSHHVVRQDLADAGSLCHGHEVCAVGAMWLAGGIQPVVDMSTQCWRLPYTSPSEREPVLSRDPALALAYNTMNELGEQELENFEWRGSGMYEGGMEKFFEHYVGHSEDYREDQEDTGEDERLAEARTLMLELIARAKHQIAQLELADA